MDYQKPDIKAKECWQVGRLISALFITALVLLIHFLMKLFLEDGTLLTAAGVIKYVIIALAFLSIVVLPGIEYRQWGYCIEEDQVVIRHGIFWVNTTVIPIIRIQNITMEQGPINKIFGLYDVEISLASGSFDILGLKEETARTITDNLKSKLYKRIQEKGVL